MIGLATLVVTDPIFEPVAVNFIDPVLPHRLDAEWAAEAYTRGEMFFAEGRGKGHSRI